MTTTNSEPSAVKKPKNRAAIAGVGLFGAGAAAALLAFSPISPLSTGEAAAQVAVATDAQAIKALPATATQDLAIPDLVEKVMPAVVSVLVEREVERRPAVPQQFQDFFRRFGDPDEGPDFAPRDEEPETRRAEAQGSGFFVDADGHVVTNNHVIEDADAISIRFSDGRELEATLVGADPLTDLAVIKVKDAPKNQAYVNFADQLKLRVGETVVAVGNPFGLGGTVTSGIVSAIGGQSRQGQFLDFIQIDAPINRGNSGGPTFDLKGRVVGVNTAIYSPNGGSVGIGFAIPAAAAKATIEQLIEKGAVTRGWLGVTLRDITDDFAAAIGRDEGAFINDIVNGTPAAKAGLEAGDVIVSVDGKSIIDSAGLSRIIAGYAPGEKVDITALRGNTRKKFKVTLGDRPTDTNNAPIADDPEVGSDAMAKDFGLGIANLDEEYRRQFSLNDAVDGVLITRVARGSVAHEAGLRPGMVVLQVDGEAVTRADALGRKVEGAKKAGKEAVLLRLQIGDRKQFAALPIEKE